MSDAPADPVQTVFEPRAGSQNVWDADVALTQRQAGRLVEAQFPDLAPASLELLGEGWDNWAYLANGAFVFRFPRRALGAKLIANECRSLPCIAPHLPLPIPLPLYRG